MVIIKNHLWWDVVDAPKRWYVSYVDNVFHTTATLSHPRERSSIKTMAEAKKAVVNKSEEIRTLASEMKAKGEKPRPVAIIAALEKRGVVVSSPQVSIVLKKMGFRPTRGSKGRRAAGKPAASTNRAAVVASSATAVSVEDILAAKKVAQQLGGTDRALAALAALKRIES